MVQYGSVKAMQCLKQQTQEESFLCQYLCVSLFSSEILIQAFSQPLGCFYEPFQVKLGLKSPELTNSKKGKLLWL